MVDNIFWLVVEPYPSEKWWSESQLGLWNSQANGKSWNWCSKAPTRQYPSEMKTQDNFGTLIRVSINQTSSNTAGNSTMFDDFPYKKTPPFAGISPALGARQLWDSESCESWSVTSVSSVRWTTGAGILSWNPGEIFMVPWLFFVLTAWLVCYVCNMFLLVN